MKATITFKIDGLPEDLDTSASGDLAVATQPVLLAAGSALAASALFGPRMAAGDVEFDSAITHSFPLNPADFEDAPEG